MTDRGSLAHLDRIDSPDLWPEIDRRDPGPPVSLGPSGVRRAALAVGALAVATAGIWFAVWALGGGSAERPVPGQSTLPPHGQAMRNGDILVYASPGPGQPEQLFLVPPGGGEPRQLTHADGAVTQAAISADGSTVAYAVAVGERADVRRIRVDGSGDTLVCGACASFTAWASSEGGHGISVGDRVNGFAFLDGGLRSATLYPAVTIREGERILARDPAGPGILDAEIALSPDGSAAVWRRSNPGAQGISPRHDLDGLYLLDAATGATLQLTTQDGAPFTTDPDEEPAWSPDGQWVVFVHGIASFGPGHLETGRDSEVWVVRRDGSGMRQVTSIDSPKAYPETPVWSPDGSRIAFILTTPRGSELEVIGADGSGLSIACGDPAPCNPGRGTLSWSPDGASLLFGGRIPGEPAGTYVVGVDGSGLRRVDEGLRDARPVGWQPLPPGAGGSVSP